MAVFAVCSNFVVGAASDKDFVLNVLFRFLQENPLRVSVDAPHGRIISLYLDAAKRTRSSDLRRWLKFLGRNPSKTIEYIRVINSDVHERQLFIDVAKETVTQRCIIVWSKQDYINFDIGDVELVERHYASARVREFDRTASSHAPDTSSAEERVMIEIENYFSDIEGSTIVVDSIVKNSFNRVKEAHSEEIARALLEIADYVNRSGNKDAGVLFNTFGEELSKSAPRKPVLRTIWNGILEVLPDVSKLAEAVTKIGTLFS